MAFYKNDFASAVLSDSDYDAISLKLIKQKSRGIISDYRFEGGIFWSVKARNGVVYNGALDANCDAIGSARWSYKDILLKKYYNCPVVIDAESFSIYDEFVGILEEEELERQKQAEQEEFNRIMEETDNGNKAFDAMVA